MEESVGNRAATRPLNVMHRKRQHRFTGVSAISREFGLGCLLAAVTVVSLTACYDSSQFTGGEITKQGLLSYPRYQARLGKVPMNTEGIYSYEFAGLPAAEMSLQLYVQGRKKSDRYGLDGLDTQLEAKISNAQGDILCQASGAPSGSESAKWSLSYGDSDTAIWHGDCLKLSFHQNQDYRLKLSVSDVDALTPDVMLIVTLEGGGIDLR